MSDVCVCMQDFLRERVTQHCEKLKPQEGELCVKTHKRHTPQPVSLVSIVVVLVWYYKCKLTNSCSTKSSTTVRVVQ